MRQNRFLICTALALCSSAALGAQRAAESHATTAVATPAPTTSSATAASAMAGGAIANTVSAPSLSLHGARVVAAAAVAEALRDGGTGVIAVVDAGGHAICLERLDGTFPAGAQVSLGKARTAALFQKPTGVFEEIIKKGRTPMLSIEGFTPLQGGVPIVVDGHVVGAVGVSGAASAPRDEEIAMAGAKALAAATACMGGAACEHAPAAALPTAAMPGGAAPVAPAMEMLVTHLERDQVDAAFAKGQPLLEVADYKIHASRRDAPGLAEVHALETDVIYVLGGSATFVTGGRLVDGKPTDAHEVRGSSIAGGDVRSLVKGDVVVVPKGTPHWFKDVQGPFTYFVVKVL